MSYFEKQNASFKRNVVAASAKIQANKLEPPVSAPSPAASITSNTSKSGSKDVKRKREPQKETYSQPAATGFGNEIHTQVTYVIEFLKNKDEAKTFREILQYLSRVHVGEDIKKKINVILKRHEKVQWIPDPKSKAWDSGTFRHKPILPIRNEADLIGYLQRKVDAEKVTLKDLKDGWPDCEDTINRLEQEHRLLVTRTKGNEARNIWVDDPSLFHEVDHEFQSMWRKVDIPSIDDVVRKLIEAGQKPASEDPSKRIKAAPKAKEKKRKAPRKGGRTTNTHMEHLLKDYSHLKR